MHDFSAVVLSQVRRMPLGGGYSTRRPAAEALTRRALVWNEASGQLTISPKKAQPSFCSEACYLVLLMALQEWERHAHHPLPPAFWKDARADFGQADGLRAWGRMNANGPGLAKWVHDLGAGVNFTDPAAARPGDFLKIFWTREIGKKEFGHLVVFMGLVHGKEGSSIRFWSSNKPGGYGEKTVPLAKMGHLLFTRITQPERFATFASLPAKDTWLSDMQTKSFSFDTVRQTCNVRAAPSVSPPPPKKLMGNIFKLIRLVPTHRQIP